MSEIKRGPGRPKGSTTGARQIIYIVIDSKIQSYEEFKSPAGSSEDELKKYTIQYVIDYFKNNHGYVDPIVYGPFYDAKGLIKTAKSTAKSLSEDEEFNSYLGIGELNGEQGKVFSLKEDSMHAAFLPIKNDKQIMKTLLSSIQNLKQENNE